MFYGGSAVTAITPGFPGTRSFLPAAPMSAVLPGQAYYPAMHSAPMHATVPMSAAPMVYGGGYGGGGYGGGYGGYPTYPSSYHQQPAVILSSAPRSRRRHRHHGHGGFLGYL